MAGAGRRVQRERRVKETRFEAEFQLDATAPNWVHCVPTMTLQTTLKLASQHIVKNLGNKRPLFVALQGPQGSGKTFLAAQLQTRLQLPPHSLRIAVLSIDDLYLPHKDLVSLAASENVLWKGRGLPGTHDIDLGFKIFSNLVSRDSSFELPRFDKSLFNGEGDRLPMDGTGPVIIQPPQVDVVILEGWLVGFHPISRDELLSRWHGVWKDEREKLGLSEAESGRLSDIQAINEKLNGYLPLWNFFDVFIQVSSAVISFAFPSLTHCPAQNCSASIP